VPATPAPPRVERSEADAPLPLVSGRFAYAPGIYRYEVATESEIRQSSDSVAAEARVRTGALLTLRFEQLGGDSLRVAVSVDSVWAHRDSLVPAPDSAVFGEVQLPLVFTTITDARGVVQVEAGSPRTECAAGEALLAVVGDLLVPVPGELVVGASWSDTATVSICRGGVPVTTGVVRHYEVLGSRRDTDGTPLMRIARTTTFSMAGTETTEHRQIIALTGRGESRTLLELDLRGGVVRSASREGTSDVTVTYGRSSTPFTQRVVQRVRLLDAGSRAP
jgi:hypothetical protein